MVYKTILVDLAVFLVPDIHKKLQTREGFVRENLSSQLARFAMCRR